MIAGNPVLKDWRRVPGASVSIALRNDRAAEDLIPSASVEQGRDLALVFRYQDDCNYIAARYPADEKVIVIQELIDGTPMEIGSTEVTFYAPNTHLVAEIKGSFAIVQIKSAERSMSSPIVRLKGKTAPGAFGWIAQHGGIEPRNFEARRSAPNPASNKATSTALYDAQQRYRGTIGDTFEWSKEVDVQVRLLDAYLPPRPPFPQDWVLILEAASAPATPLPDEGTSRAGTCTSRWSRLPRWSLDKAAAGECVALSLRQFPSPPTGQHRK